MRGEVAVREGKVEMGKWKEEGKSKGRNEQRMKKNKGKGNRK